jgi:hypothetical protein
LHSANTLVERKDQPEKLANPLFVNNWQVSSSDGSNSKKLTLNGPPESAADLKSAQAWQGQCQRTKAMIGITLGLNRLRYAPSPDEPVAGPAPNSERRRRPRGVFCCFFIQIELDWCPFIKEQRCTPNLFRRASS